MQKLLFLFLSVVSFHLIGQSSGLYTYPLQSGKVIIAIIKNEQNTHVILNNFYSDFDKIEAPIVCKLNESFEFVNCNKLTDSTYYWNVLLSHDSTFYLLTGGKSSKLELIDTVIIEKRDLDFNLLSIYKYYLPPLLFSTLLTIKDSIYHIFAVPQLILNDSLVEFISTSDINFSKTKVVSHFLNNNYITFLKPLPEMNQYIGWYSGGLAKTDNSFINPQYLDDKKLHIQGSIIDAIDSGYVAFGGAKSIIDGTGLAIVKYNPDLHHVKIDEITEDTASYELPAVSYSLVKNKSHYFISGFVNANKGSLYKENYNNLIYIGKYDKDINRIWLKKVGGDRHYLVWGVEALDDGGCCIYGMTRSKETDYKTIPFIMCVDSDGLITSTDEQNESYFDLTILGNPGSNELKFILGDFKNELTYQVLNIQGQIIAKGVGITGLNTINSDNWMQGMYVLSFIHNGKQQHQEKWIKVSN